MESQQLELDLWQSLQTATQFPETADVRSLCDALEQTLVHESLSDQLTLAGEALVQLSEVCAARANQLIVHWQQRHQPMEPVVNLDACAEFFVQSLVLDVSDLFAEPEPPLSPKHPLSPTPHRFRNSIVGAIEKEDVLNWVEQQDTLQKGNEPQGFEQLQDLIDAEYVGEWSRAIAQLIASNTVRQRSRNGFSISFPDLCARLPLAWAEVWLGLLAADDSYQLCQTSNDFYDPAGIELHVALPPLTQS